MIRKARFSCPPYQEMPSEIFIFVEYIIYYQTICLPVHRTSRSPIPTKLFLCSIVWSYILCLLNFDSKLYPFLYFIWVLGNKLPPLCFMLIFSISLKLLLASPTTISFSFSTPWTLNLLFSSTIFRTRRYCAPSKLTVFFFTFIFSLCSSSNLVIVLLSWNSEMNLLLANKLFNFSSASMGISQY